MAHTVVIYLMLLIVNNSKEEAMRGVKIIALLNTALNNLNDVFQKCQRMSH